MLENMRAIHAGRRRRFDKWTFCYVAIADIGGKAIRVFVDE
jgi:hypothetical protein